MTRIELFNKLKHKGYFDNPPQMRQALEYRENSGKHCDCHNQPSHDTEHCFHLEDTIEGLIRDGTLKAFAKSYKPSSAMVAKVHLTINTIFFPS